MKEKYSVTGMSCSACSAGIERTVKKLNGVKSVEVSLMGESMCVEYDETVIKNAEIVSAVESLGYGVGEYTQDVAKSRAPEKLKTRFFVSLSLLLPLMYLAMGSMIGLPQPPLKISVALQALLSLAVIILNFHFFTNGAKALVKKVPNMDTLVSLGAGVSFAYSVVLTVAIYANTRTHAHLYYESAAMILALVTLGKWLEEKSKRKTGNEIEKLISLMPATVTLLRGEEQERVAFSKVQKGDILLVKQGEYVPVDGEIIDGHGFVDRAAITGESMPVEVQTGDLVTGADILKSGFIKVRAQKVGAETTLSQIIKIVKDAGASKAPIQKLADKIAGVFVPVVAMLAIATFALWLFVTKDISLATNYAISVLVISCPCSLGLATPVAVMAATGRGMSLGILYKDAETLQKAKDINCVLLDKTATLTVGKPTVTDFACLQGESEYALRVAGAIERVSNHPIAECICAYAEQNTTAESLLAEEYEYETGKGASAVVAGIKYYLGNRKWIGKALDKQIGRAHV